MDKVSSRLTVYFEEPFWAGVFEHVSEGRLSVCKVIFGAEPKDYEVHEFVLKNYDRLNFSPAVGVDVKGAIRNPKRMQREVRKYVQNTGLGTKSQQALKLQQEQLRIRRKTVNRRKREAEKQRQFKLKQQKRKEKHRGR
ncbi:YjdF family protein [Luxibacter massiliensis]|uniref:YjdF family protein n=1 Tax=Luxibacter massiliensis TaxID=2219695 RepID=UPI000F068463|nr:YjdF family protein [Luxibacter massiliensis]